MLPTKADPMGTMLSAIVLMTLFFPLSRAIRNIMMGFLQWIGVDEEAVAGKAVSALMALGSFARMAGSSWDTNFKAGLGGTAKGPDWSGGGGVIGGGRIPPVGGGPSGDIAGQDTAGTGAIGRIPGPTGEQEGDAGSPGTAIKMPEAGGVPGAGGPAGQVARLTGGEPGRVQGVPPIDGGGPGGQDMPLRSPLERDVMDADRTGGIKFARVSGFFSPADHLAQGASYMYGMVAGNITAVGRLGRHMYRNISEIRRQHPGQDGRKMTLGEALKLYTRSQTVAGAAFKVGTAVAGTALGFGPPAVRRAQFAAQVSGRAYNFLKSRFRD